MMTGSTIFITARRDYSLTAILLSMLLLLLSGSDVTADRGKNSNNNRRVVEIDCAPEISTFDSYVFVDLKITDALNFEQLRELEESFMETYNEYTEENYCDLDFREVAAVSASFYEEIEYGEKYSTHRFLLLVTTECRGCDEEKSRLFSFNSRRDLLSDVRFNQVEGGEEGEGTASATTTTSTNHKKRKLKKNGKSSSSSSSEEEPLCSCPTDVGYGTPSNREFLPALHHRLEWESFAGITVQVLEVVTVPCGEGGNEGETNRFESQVLVTFGSGADQFNVSPSDVARVPEGFAFAYNDLQEGRCDARFRTIDSVFGQLQIVDDDAQRRALSRDLQFNFEKFFMFILMLTQGSCRGCPSYSFIFDDASRRRQLQDNQQSGQCFCASGSEESSLLKGSPTSEQFVATYTGWIQAERAAGRIVDIETAETAVQLEPFAPSHVPSSVPSKELSDTPSLTPSVGPSAGPSSTPSSEPSSEPSSDPSSKPSVLPTTTPSVSPSVSPSTSPSDVPSTSPSDEPSTSPSDMPSTSPSVLPSATPTALPSFTPSALPTDRPTILPSSVPSDNPSNVPTISLSAVPSSFAPSSSPSFATLCQSYEQDTILVFQTFEDKDTTGWENAKLDTSGSDFTTFLGRYQAGDAFPEYTVNFDTTKVNRMFISFQFYEIDSWDGDGVGGTDTVSMKLEGDRVDTARFGWFRGDFSEPSSFGNSTNDEVQWSITSETIAESPQGFDLNSPDQRHTVLLSFPPEMYEIGGSLKFTVAWGLVGDKDEFVGLDNLKVTACVDVAPSSTPSVMPSLSLAPTSTPTTDKPTIEEGLKRPV